MGRWKSVALGDFFLSLALDLAVLVLVLLLFLLSDLLILLVQILEPFLGGAVDFLPHLADDLGDLGYFGSWVLRLHLIVHLSPEEEEC